MATTSDGRLTTLASAGIYGPGAYTVGFYTGAQAEGILPGTTFSGSFAFGTKTSAPLVPATIYATIVPDQGEKYGDSVDCYLHASEGHSTDFIGGYLYSGAPPGPDFFTSSTYSFGYSINGNSFTVLEGAETGFQRYYGSAADQTFSAKIGDRIGLSYEAHGNFNLSDPYSGDVGEFSYRMSLSAGIYVSLWVPRTSDLQATSLDWNSGGGVDLGYEVKGADLENPTRLNLYWSDNDQFDPGDTLVYSAFTETAQSSTPYSVHVDRDLLTTPPAGSKYLLAVLDPQDIVVESDETNNVLALGLPDLVGAEFGYRVINDDTGESNGPLPFNEAFVAGATVRNDGAGNAGPFRVAFYASKDETIDPSDDLLGSAMVAGLAAGAQATATLPGTVTLNQARGWTGTIHLGYIIDPANELPQIEATRGNNANRGAVADRIDRSAVQLYDPTSIASEMATGFRTERAAALFLFRNGFSQVLPLTGSGWSRHLAASKRIVSRFDGAVRSGLAYRQNAFIRPPDATHSTYWILLQGTEAQAEPSPETALIFEAVKPGWFSYVRDWHRRFS